MMLRLNSVTVMRGQTRVVEGLDLEIAPGRVFWVIGPNGAGKSSLLRVLALLDRPAAGRIERSPASGRPFLYLHSEMALPPSSTVGAWDRLVERLLPEPRGHTDIRPQVAGRRTVRRLSTGERKRLLLDALLRRPGSLLLDEPYEHLSPGARAALTGHLEARARRDVVVVATNQNTDRARVDGGLRLDAGVAERLQGAPGVAGP